MEELAIVEASSAHRHDQTCVWLDETWESEGSEDEDRSEEEPERGANGGGSTLLLRRGSELRPFFYVPPLHCFSHFAPPIAPAPAPAAARPGSRCGGLAAVKQAAAAGARGEAEAGWRLDGQAATEMATPVTPVSPRKVGTPRRQRRRKLQLAPVSASPGPSTPKRSPGASSAKSTPRVGNKDDGSGTGQSPGKGQRVKHRPRKTGHVAGAATLADLPEALAQMTERQRLQFMLHKSLKESGPVGAEGDDSSSDSSSGSSLGSSVEVVGSDGGGGVGRGEKSKREPLSSGQRRRREWEKRGEASSPAPAGRAPATTSTAPPSRQPQPAPASPSSSHTEEVDAKAMDVEATDLNRDGERSGVPGVVSALEVAVSWDSATAAAATRAGVEESTSTASPPAGRRAVATRTTRASTRRRPSSPQPVLEPALDKATRPPLPSSPSSEPSVASTGAPGRDQVDAAVPTPAVPRNLGPSIGGRRSNSASAGRRTPAPEPAVAASATVAAAAAPVPETESSESPVTRTDAGKKTRTATARKGVSSQATAAAEAAPTAGGGAAATASSRPPSERNAVAAGAGTPQGGRGTTDGDGKAEKEVEMAGGDGERGADGDGERGGGRGRKRAKSGAEAGATGDDGKRMADGDERQGGIEGETGGDAVGNDGKRADAEDSGSSSGDDSDSGNSEMFEVQTVLATRKPKGRRREFKVRWMGYSSEHDSWEPIANFVDLGPVRDYFRRQSLPVPRDIERAIRAFEEEEKQEGLNSGQEAHGRADTVGPGEAGDGEGDRERREDQSEGGGEGRAVRTREAKEQDSEGKERASNVGGGRLVADAAEKAAKAAATIGVAGAPEAATGVAGAPEATTGVVGAPEATTGVVGAPEATTGVAGAPEAAHAAKSGEPQEAMGVVGSVSDIPTAAALVDVAGALLDAGAAAAAARTALGRGVDASRRQRHPAAAPSSPPSEREVEVLVDVPPGSWRAPRKRGRDTSSGGSPGGKRARAVDGATGRGERGRKEAERAAAASRQASGSSTSTGVGGSAAGGPDAQARVQPAIPIRRRRIHRSPSPVIAGRHPTSAPIPGHASSVAAGMAAAAASAATIVGKRQPPGGGASAAGATFVLPPRWSAIPTRLAARDGRRSRSRSPSPPPPRKHSRSRSRERARVRSRSPRGRLPAPHGRAPQPVGPPASSMSILPSAPGTLSAPGQHPSAQPRSAPVAGITASGGQARRSQPHVGAVGFSEAFPRMHRVGGGDAAPQGGQGAPTMPGPPMRPFAFGSRDALAQQANTGATGANALPVAAHQDIGRAGSSKTVKVMRQSATPAQSVGLPPGSTPRETMPSARPPSAPRPAPGLASGAPIPAGRQPVPATSAAALREPSTVPPLPTLDPVPLSAQARRAPAPAPAAPTPRALARALAPAAAPRAPAAVRTPAPTPRTSLSPRAAGAPKPSSSQLWMETGGQLDLPPIPEHFSAAQAPAAAPPPTPMSTSATGSGPPAASTSSSTASVATPTLDQLRSVQLKRLDLGHLHQRQDFEELVRGCFIRVNDSRGYRLLQIRGVKDEGPPYTIRVDGSTISTCAHLMVTDERVVVPLNYVSGSAATQEEYDAWRSEIDRNASSFIRMEGEILKAHMSRLRSLLPKRRKVGKKGGKVGHGHSRSDGSASGSQRPRGSGSGGGGGSVVGSGGAGAPADQGRPPPAVGQRAARSATPSPATHNGGAQDARDSFASVVSVPVRSVGSTPLRESQERDSSRLRAADEGESPQQAGGARRPHNREWRNRWGPPHVGGVRGAPLPSPHSLHSAGTGSGAVASARSPARSSSSAGSVASSGGGQGMAAEQIVKALAQGGIDLPSPL